MPVGALVQEPEEMRRSCSCPAGLLTCPLGPGVGRETRVPSRITADLAARAVPALRSIDPACGHTAHRKVIDEDVPCVLEGALVLTQSVLCATDILPSFPQAQEPMCVGAKRRLCLFSFWRAAK